MMRSRIMEESVDRILSQMRKRTIVLARNMGMIKRMKNRSPADNMAMIMSQKKKRTKVMAGNMDMIISQKKKRKKVMVENMDMIITQKKKRTKVTAGNMGMIKRMKNRSPADNMAMIMSQK